MTKITEAQKQFICRHISHIEDSSLETLLREIYIGLINKSTDIPTNSDGAFTYLQRWVPYPAHRKLSGGRMQPLTIDLAITPHENVMRLISHLGALNLTLDDYKLYWCFHNIVNAFKHPAKVEKNIFSTTSSAYNVNDLVELLDYIVADDFSFTKRYDYEIYKQFPGVYANSAADYKFSYRGIDVQRFLNGKLILKGLDDAALIRLTILKEIVYKIDYKQNTVTGAPAD